MKNYIVYFDNGEIIKTGQCQNGDLHLQGKNVIEGIADDSTQYVDNGVVVNMPKKPNIECFFNYESKCWIPDESAQKTQVKAKRNLLLLESDWTQLPDVPLATKTAWAQYRQQLRDITIQSGYPFNVVWPTQPQ